MAPHDEGLEGLQRAVDHSVRLTLKDIEEDQRKMINNVYQQQMAAAQQHALYYPSQSCGDFLGGLSSAVRVAGWQNTNSSAVFHPGIANNHYAPGEYEMFDKETKYNGRIGRTEAQEPKKSRGIKFMRLHQEIQMEEGEDFREPLDKLRVSVSRWLKHSGERAYTYA